MTKQQMETRIAELEAALKAEGKEDPADSRRATESAAIAEMQKKLEAALSQNEKLVSQVDVAVSQSTELDIELQKLSDDIRRLSDEHAGVRGSLALREQELKKAVEHNVALTAENASMRENGVITGDCAVLGGTQFRIVHRCTAKWVNEQVLKRFVPEDATALILERTGD